MAPRFGILVSYLLLTLSTQTISAAIWDRDKETLIAERLAGEILDSEVLWIPATSGKAFPAIFSSAGPYARPTAIILLHGMGGHPDWPALISPLRQSLPARHWTTLSIQLPVLKAGQPVADYSLTLAEGRRRIEQAIHFLQQRNYQQVVLIGHGFGATTALYTIDQTRHPAISGLVAVSILARKYLEPAVDLLALLAAQTLPVLDIYGANDRPDVIDMAADRRLAARENNHSGFTQIRLEDADHYYTGQEQVLLEEILDWLEQLTATPPATLE